MKYILLVSTFLLVIAFSATEVDALDCHRCIYNISAGAPVHNAKCNEKPFEADASISTITCDEGQECFTAPAYLGNDDGKYLVSLERGCGRNTGDGCIKWTEHNDPKNGYLKVCADFCDTDQCNTVDEFDDSEKDGLECHRCIYNVSLGAPEHNPKCKDEPFDSSIGEIKCDAGQECFTAPAWLGNDDGKFLVSLERGCGQNTGDGCVEFNDANGFLRICGDFCNRDLCNTRDAFDGAGILHVNIVALLSMTVFAMFMVR